MSVSGYALKLTHTGVITGSLYIQDITPKGGNSQTDSPPGPVYIGRGETVTLTYTSLVAKSFESGNIKTWVDVGWLTAEFEASPAFIDAVGGGAPSGPAGGDLSGTYPNPEVTNLTIAGEEQGSILYNDGSDWVQLPPGGAGEVLQTNGPGADPSWNAVAGTGDVTAAASLTDNTLIRGDGGGKGIQDSGITVDDSDNVTLPAGATLSAETVQSTIIYVDTVRENTVNNGVLVNGIRQFGRLASDPSLGPAPQDGDEYYNTALRMQMYYDAFRSKWLSVEAESLQFGRDGYTAPGQYYRGADGRVMSANNGWYTERSGTVVSLTFTRDSTTNAGFDILADGVVIATVGAGTLSSGRSISLDGVFTFGQVLAVRNQASGSTTSNVIGKIRVHWRA